MSVPLRIIINCLLVASLTIGAIAAAVWMDGVVGSKVVSLLRENGGSTNLEQSLILYDGIRFGIIGGFCAILMLWLKPRRAGLYCLASAITSSIVLNLHNVLTNASLHVQYKALAIGIVLSIPVLYWLFCRFESNRHNKRL